MTLLVVPQCLGEGVSFRAYYFYPKIMRQGALGEKPSVIRVKNPSNSAAQTKCPQWSDVHCCPLHLPCASPAFVAKSSADKLGLSEAVPQLALGSAGHQWAQATSHWEPQEKTFPAEGQGVAQLLAYLPHSTDPGELCSLTNMTRRLPANGIDTFLSLCFSHHWHTTLCNLFPGENPASAMSSYQKWMQNAAYTQLSSQT